MPGWLWQTFPNLHTVILNDRSSLEAIFNPGSKDIMPLAMYQSGLSTLEQSAMAQGFINAVEELFPSKIKVIFGSLESLFAY
jgi:hypothetical protein